MGSFQLQKPIRQKLLSKQQRRPYPNQVEKQKVALSQSFCQFQQPQLIPSPWSCPGCSFPRLFLHTTWTSHSIILNCHLDTTCYLKCNQFYVLACGLATNRAMNSQTLFLYEAQKTHQTQMPTVVPCANSTQQHRFTKLLCFLEIIQDKKQWI